MPNLYERDTFLNHNIPFLFNKEITEYDMKDAGFSLTKEFKLLDSDIIKMLTSMDKVKRKIKMGKIQSSDYEYKENIKKAFVEARRMFFVLNDIDDKDVISIKKDAIITSKHCKVTSVGKYIEFRPKNMYSSFIQLPNRIELYYNPSQLDVKGIGDDKLELHKDFMIKFLKMYFRKMETEPSEEVIEFCKRFIDRYKHLELEVGYYREFNSLSVFNIPNDDGIIYNDYWEHSKKDIDIQYNFFNVLLKIIQIPL